MSQQSPEWMKLPAYAARTGHTADAVQKLLKDGKWRQGYHCKLVEGRLWVSYTRAQEWVETWHELNRTGHRQPPATESSFDDTGQAGKRSSSTSLSVIG